jgi:hypothetical protein
MGDRRCGDSTTKCQGVAEGVRKQSASTTGNVSKRRPVASPLMLVAIALRERGEAGCLRKSAYISRSVKKQTYLEVPAAQCGDSTCALHPRRKPASAASSQPPQPQDHSAVAQRKEWTARSGAAGTSAQQLPTAAGTAQRKPRGRRSPMRAVVRRGDVDYILPFPRPS